MSGLDLADIQGNILRGYRAANARHLAVNIPRGETAGRCCETCSLRSRPA